MKFTFTTDEKSQRFCEGVASEMGRLFGISKGEAVGRINRHWSGQDLRGETNIVYHEDATFWAKQIYFDPDSDWWQDPNPKPRPYP